MEKWSEDQVRDALKQATTELLMQELKRRGFDLDMLEKAFRTSNPPPPEPDQFI